MNIEWKKITLEDKELITSYYRMEQSRSCEDTFANNYLWEPHYGVQYSVIADRLVFKSEEEGLSVGFPHGKGDLKVAMEIIMDYFKEQGKPFQMHLVTKSQFEQLEAIYPQQFQIVYDRDMADYIYETEKLISLAGKKLHAKRNHINKFKAEHADWQYEELNEENKADCFEMASKWCEANGCSDDPGKKAEFCVTLNALNYLEQLELVGGIIRAEGEIVAFAIGEEVCSDTFVVHIEKAFADIQGAYPMINQQFAEHAAGNYQYINREEDTGAEGLRKAKMSYYPVFLQEKGLVTKR